MSMADTRKEPETNGNLSRSAPGIDRKHTLRGVPVLSGRMPKGRPASSGLVNLSFVQAEALRKFSKDTERATSTRDTGKLFEVRQSLAAAKRALSPREWAALDLLLIKGRDITRLSQVSGQPVETLNQLLHDAADALAAHYQSREAA